MEDLGKQINGNGYDNIREATRSTLHVQGKAAPLKIDVHLRRSRR